MISTSARLLRLIALLSSRPSWTSTALAERLEVTDRTVRRDVARLRELGYGVESDPGPWGGYRLGEGGRALPLILDDEESLAVAVALREAARSGILGGDQAVLSALLKLRRLVPASVAARLAAMDTTFEHTDRAGEQPLSTALLAALANAARRGERLRLSYRDLQARESVREVDPHRLVFTGHRWYLVALDVSRGRWRTFRADRVVDARTTGRPTEITDPPDAARLVARMITSDYPVYARIRLDRPVDEARRLVHPTAGTHDEDGPDGTIVTLGGLDPESLAERLLRLGVPFRVLSPDSVRDAVHRRATALAALNLPT
ncbi:helix-turn-helix transcriptional regulator [Umezawaea endophytica]|uniref:WYL domain-containing protein n=1 Tax=Umezawaea endophytica TaxID=1654476 RepID=A0A9X2VFS1_9PSEU|nr:WYL domain-containing protein [Umezawaea endophytica]MCS7475766.1 WYL domain-containing protein [Umezawaea endophytica]